MREYEFRGKRISDGKWVYGLLIKTVSGKYVIQRESTEQKFLITDLVDIETVGEYADLKDKNKNKIYNGDIVKTRITKNKVIGDEPEWSKFAKWEEKEVIHISVIEYWKSMVQLGYRLRNGKGKTLLIKSQAMLNTMETEIIGNIYDNTDLLKG